MTTWIVQNNLIKEELITSMEDACKSTNNNYVGVKIVPFSDTVEFGFPPDFKVPKGKLIPYGSTSMVKMINNSNLDKSGFFFNEENFRTSKWIKELDEIMLNYDAQIMPLFEAMKLTGNLFMKPDNDLKDFTGCEVSGEEIKKFYDEVSAGGFTFSTDIPVVLCPLKNTGWEYRFFMIGDEIIASSSYKLKTMIRQDKAVPEDVKFFAKSAACQWHPDDVYVMDICETDDGLAVVEFNCFNASGFYACNVEDVVSKVSDYVENL